MNRLAIFLLLLSPIFVHAQKRLNLTHDNAFAFYDYNEKAFCVLDDSTFLWKYNQQAVKWEKTPIQLSIEMPFEQFLSDFIPMSDNGTPVYFVHAGCGVVYSMENNMIKRHDHSFYHMNQFGGSFFMDEGEPRIYGGYGLFTSKNIITRYDTIEREWFVLNTINNPPPPGVKNIIKKHGKIYYVLDGLCGLYSQYQSFNNLWRFNVQTKKWTNLGRVNPTILGKQIELNYENSQIQDNLFSCFPNKIVVYDFEKLRYRKYKTNTSDLYRKIINVGELFLIFKYKSKPSRYVEITNSNFLKNLDLEEGDILLKKPSFLEQFNWLIVLLLVLFSLLFILLTRKNSNRKKKSNSSNELTSESLFEEFNPTEVQLIQLLLAHQETGLEISFINDLVNQDQPSVDTLKKRRETLLKELRYKLAAKFNIPQEEIFIEQRMVSDKRMKLLFLNKLVIFKI
jgi:hypothetical protein